MTSESLVRNDFRIDSIRAREGSSYGLRSSLGALVFHADPSRFGARQRTRRIARVFGAGGAGDLARAARSGARARRKDRAERAVVARRGGDRALGSREEDRRSDV